MEEDNKEIILSPYEYNHILNIQQEILEMLASHHKTQTILSKLCFLAQTLLPNSVATIMIKGENGLMNIKSAPSIPQENHKILANLKPGPKNGSCGNAVFKNEPQFVQNTLTDKRWENLRHVAIDFNIRACWSMPIRNKEKKAIGSFALSSFESRIPSNFHKKLLEIGASIVSIVLTNEQSEKKLQLFSNSMQNSIAGIIITNEKNEIIELNKAIENIFGYKKEELLGKNPRILSSHKNNSDFYKNMWGEIKAKSKWSGEIVNKKKDNSIITQWVNITALYDEYDQASNYLAIFTDLTQLKDTQDRVEYLAYHDPLTNLYNKSYLEKQISSRDKKTLILLNINNFSYINTAYGFDMGDELLIDVSYTLKENFKCDILCKINSDEFALLFHDKINIENKILEIQEFFIKNPINIEKIKLNITFSYGAVYGKKNLLRKAATALKTAKENGKNRYEIFHHTNSVNYAKRESFIKYTNLIRDALDNDYLTPFYQGIYDNTTNQITKFEALARIVIEDKIISPFEFLEPARLSGLLPEITKMMIDKTMEYMSKNSFDFSLNITEEDLSENYLCEYLEEKTNEYGINPKRIILEILEGISSSGKKNHIKQLTQLKKDGYRIAIDDFGAEYSNFERILDLDIDFIKIDAKYIKDIDTNKRSYEIVKAIVFFTKNVNIPCIAEFVHNEKVQNILKDLKIDFSQGYYFSVPNKEIKL